MKQNYCKYISTFQYSNAEKLKKILSNFPSTQNKLDEIYFNVIIFILLNDVITQNRANI